MESELNQHPSHVGWGHFATDTQVWKGHPPITCLSEPFNEAYSETFSNSHTERRKGCLYCKVSEVVLPTWSSQLWYHCNMNTYTSVLGTLCSSQQYNVSTMNVFVRYKTVLHLTKTFMVKTLYDCNLLCYVRCSTSLLTFKTVAMSL